jgi:Zinc-finger associated domain (zf-AD)
MVNKLKTCRCCLAEAKTESELYEFSSEVSVDSEPTTEPQHFVKISECFKHITLIAIPEDAEDASKICSQCLSDLKFCFLFQQKCLEADKVLSETCEAQGNLKLI